MRYFYILMCLFPLVAFSQDSGEEVSTNMDFDSSMIDGSMKSPSGFFMLGRNRQKISNMVDLRKNFRDKMRNTKSAVKAMVR